MDVISANQPGNATGLEPRGSTAPDSSGQLNAGGFSTDFETFLKMLTTQLRNQDPLNPVESSDFAVQLATFATVEQQVLTNDLLTDLGARIGAQGLSQVSVWIGLEALSEVPVTFAGHPVPVLVTVDPQADAAEIVATNVQGFVVNRQPIPTTSEQALWSGLDSLGLPLDPGEYALSVHSLVNDETIARHDARVYRRIVEAQFDSDETVLVLESGQRISPDQVLGLRPISQ